MPVYGLGTYGDGRPYYAMRFIRGDSLKEADRDVPRTTRRSKATPVLGRWPCGSCCCGSSTCATRSSTPTAAGCCTATSSRATSSSASMARRWWWIGAWPRRSGAGTEHGGGGADADPVLGQRQCGDAARLGAGHAGVYESRAGAGRPRPARPSQRRVQPGGDAVLRADGQAAVRGRRRRRRPRVPCSRASSRRRGASIARSTRRSRRSA